LRELTADNPIQTERWRVLQAEVDVLDRDTLGPLIALHQQVAAGEANQAELSQLVGGGRAQRGFRAVKDVFTLAIGSEDHLLAQRTQLADDEDVRLMQVLIWGAIATVTLGLVFAAMLSTSVGHAMERLAKVAQAIAAGDLSKRIALVRTDEIGRAAEAFDAMADVLQQELDERARAQAATDSLLNAAAEGIFGTGRHGLVTMMNTSAERMTGYSLEDVRSQSLHSLVHYSRKDGSPYPADECPTRAAVRNGEILHVRDEVFWRKDGTPFAVEYTVVPIRTDGRNAGAVMTFRDITQQLAVERMKDEFISVVSHELRTPLTSIRGSLGLMAAGVLGPLPERGGRMIDLALSNTDRLIRLVSDILDIERIESGRVEMDVRSEDARELVQRSIENIASVADAAGVQLVSRAESIQLQVDSDRIHQTLTNLLSNAIKFSDRGSEVAVDVRRENGSAVFSVHDRGRGIPGDKLESVFRRFEQVDASDSRQKGGTGLGLAIARSIVQQHGGRIWVESALGQGSTFYFTVPIRS
jgi:PAS domain S-box-containing protein